MTGIAAAATLLAGCTVEPPAQPTASSTTATSTATPTPTPTAAAAPALHPDGTAHDNLPLFTSVVDQVWATANRAKGRVYIDSLVRAGFDKSAMQVTKDKSTVGHAAESLQFSVLWNEDECLIGQVGPATGTPVTLVMPALDGSMCLIGDTRPIDW